MQAFEPLKFLQHPQCTDIRSYETEKTRIVCVDKKVSVSYPVPYYSYQMHLTYFIPEYEVVEGYTVEPGFVIKRKGESEISIHAEGAERAIRLDKILDRFKLFQNDERKSIDFRIAKSASGALHLLALIPRDQRSVLFKITGQDY